ncbi:hypothetical protein [Streptomyces sp. NPDC020917]|uniref:hypothetical protein n=1 Tax=Streptomyces sp. NPDC020917 TaxID=3365102 RepID=UPI00378C4783
MRVLPSATGAALAVAATVLLSPTAFADAPGDNGTVKIHDAKTDEELVKNEPHVCTFYLDAFYFDGRQQAAWEIDQQAPTGKAVAAKGAITLDAKGHGRTADMTLPDGHYKLVWNFDGEHGKAKHKVFWVACDNGGTPTPSDSGSPTPSVSDTSTAPGSTSGGSSSGGSESGGSSGGSESGGSTGTPGESGGSTSASPSPSATTGSDSGSLASTGASVGGIAALAAVLLGAGVFVRFRRKGAARQH